MRLKFYKALKIIGTLLLLLFVVLLGVFYWFSQPTSTKSIKSEFSDSNVEVYIKEKQFKGFKYRILETQKEIDTTIPTIIFIHGSIGSAFDFKNYLTDTDLNKNANLIAYDRIGYGIYETGNVQESIAFEVELLEDLSADLLTERTILVGYSYGGPIALASKKSYKKVILLAPAVYSKVEPMPFALSLYKWKSTRWLVPEIWKSASKEKLSHKSDLLKFEKNWNTTTSNVLSIHGDKDWIVPYENSLYLNNMFTSNQFELVTLQGAGHGLVWSHFEDIKSKLLQQLK